MSERPPLRPIFNNFVRAKHTGLTPFKQVPKFKRKIKKTNSRGRIDFSSSSSAISERSEKSPQSSPLHDALDRVIEPNCPPLVQDLSKSGPKASDIRPPSPLALPLEESQPLSLLLSTEEFEPLSLLHPHEESQPLSLLLPADEVKPPSPLPTELAQVPSVKTPGAKSQRDRLENETKRLMGMAEEWSQHQESTPSLPDWVVDEIDSFVGQTRLLTTSKFRQFASLVNEYESGDPKVTHEDLDGFWEMMYIQVEGLDTKYRKLVELKESEWVREVETRKPRKVKKMKKQAPVVHSRIRDLIQERRKSLLRSPLPEERRESSVFVPLEELTLSHGLNSDLTLDGTGRRSSFYYRIN